jgi:hypothetical protein
MKVKKESDITTVKVKKRTKERLDKLKLHPRESYDEILQSMLGILNICRSDPERAQGRLRKIERQNRMGKREEKRENQDRDL